MQCNLQDEILFSASHAERFLKLRDLTDYNDPHNYTNKHYVHNYDLHVITRSWRRKKFLKASFANSCILLKNVCY